MQTSEPLGPCLEKREPALAQGMLTRIAMSPSQARPIRVEARPVAAEVERDLARVQWLAKMLDSNFRIAGVRFGWDAIIGLIPVGGDLATAALALYPVWLAGRHELGSLTIARMLGNVAIDAIVGAVPILGDIFDIAWKANRRNLALFEQAVQAKCKF